jgi:hypothetical protein
MFNRALSALFAATTLIVVFANVHQPLSIIKNLAAFEGRKAHFSTHYKNSQSNWAAEDPKRRSRMASPLADQVASGRERGW